MATDAPRPRPRRFPLRARYGRVLGAFALLLALSLPLGLRSDGHAAAPLIGDADVHVDTIQAQDDLEINLSLSQAQDDCGGTALNGRICLRYGVEADDSLVDAGYGLIAARDVKVTGSSVTLTTNTASYPGFHLRAGHGGAISITWKQSPGSVPVTAHGHTSTLSPATVAGTMLGRSLSGTLVQADLLIDQ